MSTIVVTCDMSYITRNLRQKATYWEAGTPDGFGGTTYGAPVEIKCRWEDRVTQFRDFTGAEAISNARVYVDRELNRENGLWGWLYLGVSTATSPKTVSGAREIRDFRQIPSLDGRSFERRVLL